jgi:hypothetical protein
MHIKNITMKIEQFQLRGNNSVCAGAFRLLHGRAPAHLRGNIDVFPSAYQYRRSPETVTLKAKLNPLKTKRICFI